MKHILLIQCVCLIFAFNCKKKEKSPPTAPPLVSVKQDSLYFIFLNKIGFRQDSIYLGNGENKVFVCVMLRSGYYNINTKKSNIYLKTYNRNNNDPTSSLADSIMHHCYPLYINSQYNFIVTLVWQKWHGSFADVVREVRFQKNPLGNDTIKENGDKQIKFTWPSDTASGRYTKIYDGH
jgi:hypothetical protein